MLLSVVLLWLLLPVSAFRRTVFTATHLSSSAQRVTPLSTSSSSKVRANSYDSRLVNHSLIGEGSLIEYVSSKGSRRLAIVKKGVAGAHLDVLNEARKAFSVPVSRVTYVIQGSFLFTDLLRLEGLLGSVSVSQAQAIWEVVRARNGTGVRLEEASDILFGNRDPTRVFTVSRLMFLYSSIFFERNSDDEALAPLPVDVVLENLKDREALSEFKSRYARHVASKTSSPMSLSLLATGGSNSSDRVIHVVDSYTEGLRQVVLRAHPWVVQGWARRKVDESAVAKGKELLELLELAPTVKNARTVLEAVGRWPAHINLEKYIMDIRDIFPLPCWRRRSTCRTTRDSSQTLTSAFDAI